MWCGLVGACGNDEARALSACTNYVPGCVAGEPDCVGETGATFNVRMVVGNGAELLRNLFIWSAFILLLRGDRHGGPEQITTIEQIRLDMMDGELDGKLNSKRAKARTATVSPI